MKPPTSEKVVFGKGRSAAERIRRGAQVGVMVMDSIAPAKHRYSEYSAYNRRAAEADATRKGVVNASDTLRRDFRGSLEKGVQLEAPTKQGGKITATGIKRDEGLKMITTWSLSIESETGKTSQFAVDVKVNPGTQWDEKTSNVKLNVIDPDTGRSYSASSYVGTGEAEANNSVAAALGQLHQAHHNGSLVVTPMPTEATHQPLPNVA